MSIKDISAKVDSVEGKLKGKLFVGGEKPNAEDVKLFNDLFGANNLNVYRWVKHIATFTADERQSWGAPVKVTVPKLRECSAPDGVVIHNATDVNVSTSNSVSHSSSITIHTPHAPKAEHKKVSSKPAPKPIGAAAVDESTSSTSMSAGQSNSVKEKHEEKPAAAAEDEDIDLFGETTEEEKAALEAKKAADAAKKKEKKGGAAKSSILFDIKAWDDTIDLEALAAKLHAIERDGLTWGQHKLAPVAFGVNKLQQLVIIEDDKVSGDDLEDIIMGFEDEVQSIDIVAWNKV